MTHYLSVTRLLGGPKLFTPERRSAFRGSHFGLNIDEDKWMRLRQLMEIRAQKYPAGHPDHDHEQALMKTGFWGKQGAGCIFFAQATGRFGIAHRSADVQEPDTHGTVGGAIDETEDPAAAVVREAAEEVGYMGPHKLVPLDVFEDGESGFRYTTFVMVVPEEFQARLNWENSGFDWVKLGQWPQPVHPGFAKSLAKPNVITKLRTLAGANV